MTILLSEKESQVSLKTSECITNFNQDQDYKLLLGCPCSQSQGYKRSINLRFGINLLIRDYQLQDHLIEEILPWEPSVKLELGFNIVGKSCNKDSSNSGQCFLHFGTTPTEIGFTEWSSAQRVIKIDLHLTKPSKLENFASSQLELMPSQLRKIIDTDEEFYRNLGAIAPATGVVLQQILYCPYQGRTEQIYLESKALELIVLQSTQGWENRQDHDQLPRLRRSDLDRLYQVRDLLVQDLHNPPSLLDLAHQVGLNDCTLKRGFRQVFGTTVFGYLRRHRLTQAKQLLRESEMNVAQVSATVGYAHPGYFAAAFKQAFGVSPKAFRNSNFPKNSRL